MTAGAEPSQQGRRVLVAPVTGELGERIQAWREQWDPEQARRLPPHVTLCYWPPADDIDALEAQVRHAYPLPVAVWLGGVHEFDSPDGTFYVAVQQAGALDAARARLFDGTHAALGGRQEWTWHVTCVRYGARGDREALRAAAAGLRCVGFWTLDTVLYLELRGDIYEQVATWRLQSDMA